MLLRLSLSPLSLFSLCTLIAVIMPLSAADAIISHPGITLTITDDEARDLVLGRRTTWNDGTRAVIVMVTSGQQPPLERLAGRSGGQLMQTWKRLVFTGKASMPVQCADEATVVKTVANTPGALAVVDQAAATADVHILLTR